MKSLPFGSDLGQTGEWGAFAQIWEVIYLGQLEAFTKRNPPFSQLLCCKNGGLSGRSVGIRTRGLLDPNSVRDENRSNMRPLGAIVCKFPKMSNYCVHTVRPLLSHSGSAFGSVEFTVPLKSEFWERLKAFPFSGAIIKVPPQKSHYRQANRQHTAGQQLTKRNKQITISTPAPVPIGYFVCSSYSRRFSLSFAKHFNSSVKPDALNSTYQIFR